MGGGNNCRLAGFFGSCQDKSKKNAENILRLADFVEEGIADVHRLRKDTNEMFFMVSRGLSELKKTQDEIIQIQNQNWKTVEEQFKVFENPIYILRNCDQLLYSRQQINFKFDCSSLLALAYTNIKTYRSALFAYKLNLMTSIPILVKRELRMSLVSKESLSTILNIVANEQVSSQDRLSLAIPTTEILSYYEAELLKDTVVI